MKHLPVLRARRVPRVLLALTVLCALVLPAAAEEARMIIPEANLHFKANDDFTEVTITAFINSDSFKGKVIEVPSAIQGVPVTAIGSWAFDGAGKAGGIEGIFIPDSVKRIGYNAFYAAKFNIIQLSEGLEIIGEQAFRRSNATAINIPSTVKVIGQGAFHECHIESATIPEHCRIDSGVVENSTFSGSNIKKLVFPPSRVILGKEAFPDCNQLEEIEIPDGFEACSWDSEVKTLADCIGGAKIAASFALQKKLKSVEVKRAFDAYAEETAAVLSPYVLALYKGEYEDAARLLSQYAEAYRYLPEEEKVHTIAWHSENNWMMLEAWEAALLELSAADERIRAYNEAVAHGNYEEALTPLAELRENVAELRENAKTWSLAWSIWNRRAVDAMLAVYNSALAAGDYKKAFDVACEVLGDGLSVYNPGKWFEWGVYSTLTRGREMEARWWEIADKEWWDGMYDEWKQRENDVYNEVVLHPFMQARLAEGMVEELDGTVYFSIPVSKYCYWDREGLYSTFFIKSELPNKYIREKEFVKLFNEFAGMEYTLKKIAKKSNRSVYGEYEHYLVREATPEDFAAAEQARREAEAKAAEEARLAAEKQAEEARRAHEAAIESAFKEGKLHTNLYYIRLSSKKGEVLFDSVPVACEEAGLQKKDVLTAASVAFADGSTVAIPVPADADNAGALSVQNTIRAIPAPATLTLTVRRGSGKKAQTLTFTIPVEWNKDELRALGLN